MATAAHGAAAIFQSTIGRSQSKVYFRVGLTWLCLALEHYSSHAHATWPLPPGLVGQTGRQAVQTRALKHRPSRPAARCVTPSVNAVTSPNRWHWSSRRSSKSDVIKCVTTGRRRGAVSAFQATFDGRPAPPDKRGQTANSGPPWRIFTITVLPGRLVY